jgi:hypothetical protein
MEEWHSRKGKSRILAMVVAAVALLVMRSIAAAQPPVVWNWTENSSRNGVHEYG